MYGSDKIQLKKQTRKVIVAVQTYLTRVDSIHVFSNNELLIKHLKTKNPVRLTWQMGEDLKRDLKQGKVCEVPLHPEPTLLTIQLFRL